VLAGFGAAVLPAPAVRGGEPASFGLTPVFLESDVHLLARLESYLSRAIGRRVALVKRRTYQEMTALLLSQQLDAAWICGFPLVQHPDRLSVVAVPVYRGEPLYRSYLIVNTASWARTFDDLRGTVHAFSDPDSNSGFLVTRHLLALMGSTPTQYFSRFFFTYGHRNVVRAVSASLALSGSVDGYIWDVLAEIEPGLTEGTRILSRSGKMGFPPVASPRSPADPGVTRALGDALIHANRDAVGSEVLAALRLDGFTASDMGLFDSIAAAYELVRRQS
jgi:phosphonate transport system substrate-binding protein